MVAEYYDILDSPLVLLPHRGNYLLPVSYNVLPNNRPYERLILSEQRLAERGPFVDNLEAEFQISFSILTNKNIFNSGFYTFIGYTHHSWWQVYNSEWSKPFRETNYMPEIFTRKVLDKPLSAMGITLLAYDLGYIHQSNGQVQEVSRSWDRLFGRLSLVADNTLIMLTAWYRLPEDADVDDNPDIHKYLGYGNIFLKYGFAGHDFALLLRPGEEYFGGELSYSFPIKLGLRFFAKYTGGYGSSMIDYNHNVERYAVGMSLSDPFSRTFSQIK